jgi:HEAT repeat protein
MSLLGLVWLVAIALMSFSLATMTALIGARIVHQHQRARRAARRAIVLPELVHHIGGLTGGAIDLKGLETDAVLMAEVVRDLASLVRGREQVRLMDALQSLGVDQALRTLLRRGSTVQRVLAAEALVYFPGEATYASLLEASRRDAPRVRLSALRSAIELGQAPPIGEMLDSVIGGAERASLLFSDLLQRAVRTQVEEALAALGRADLPRPVRLILLQALGGSGDDRVLGPLLQVARSADPEIRAAALGALGVLGHPGAAQVVESGLADADWRVRLKAIECVRRVGLTEFFTQVMTCANDDVWWVRHRAGQTLMSLAEKDVAKLRSFVADAPKHHLEAARLPQPAEPAFARAATGAL